MMSRPPHLTPAELERLAYLSEECGELQKAIGKVLRHGYRSRNPEDPQAVENRAALEEEAADVVYAISLMVEGGELREKVLDRLVQSKINRHDMRWFHHQQQGEKK